MKYLTIPEERSAFYSNAWVRKTKYGKEYFNKDFYNSDFTIKPSIEDIQENIQKEILLSEIDLLLQ
jgi:hypothetical protein